MVFSQEWVAIISSITTIIMVVLTTYYAILTHRILKYQKDIAKLEYRPFLKLESIFPIFSINDTGSIYGVVIGIKLTNISRVLLKYNISRFRVDLEGVSNENAVYLNTGGYVYPQQTVDYYHRLISISDDNIEILNGEIEYELTYFSTENIKYTSNRVFAFTIFPQTKRIEWKSLYEEESDFN